MSRGAGNEPIGLLAGAGLFPVTFARAARAMNLAVGCVGLKNLAPQELRELCDHYAEVSIARFGSIFRAFRRMGVQRIVMAGKVHKAPLLSPWRVWQLLPDWTTLRFWYSQRRPDNRDDTLLLGVIDEFERAGFQFASALDYCPEILARPGVLTRRAPGNGESSDIDFGWDMAKEMGRLDVGQSVAVRQRAVIAVEAIEGTDKAIMRAGELCRRGGFVVVKVAKPRQDMRFDVPTVGTNTIESMRQAGATALAIEAGKTILLEEAKTIALADQYGIAIIALDRG